MTIPELEQFCARIEAFDRAFAAGQVEQCASMVPVLAAKIGVMVFQPLPCREGRESGQCQNNGDLSLEHEADFVCEEGAISRIHRLAKHARLAGKPARAAALQKMLPESRGVQIFMLPWHGPRDSCATCPHRENKPICGFWAQWAGGVNSN